MSAITDPHDIAAELNRRLTGREAKRHAGMVLLPQLKQTVCADGFSVSIQASESHYCSPRSSFGPWYQVECGYPSAPMPTLGEWMEDGNPETDTSTVWGYVPISKVAEVLAAHGGLMPVTETVS